jgi:tetratricopeptide (TPR) repeat protein
MSLRLCWPWRKFVISGCIGGGALILAMLDSSPRVIAAEARQRLTLTTTDKINQDLRKELKALEQKLSPTEKKLLKQTQLDKLVNNLKLRDKFKDAMRQYAKLEKVLNRLSANQQFKSNQRLLNEIARQLLKAGTTKKLGQQLLNGKYRQAGQLLREFKQTGDSQRNLEKLKKVLAKMKKAAEQLVGNKSKFKERLSALKKAIDRYDKKLQQAAKMSDSNTKEALAQAEQQADEQLDNLSEALEQQQVTDEFIKKLMKMRRAMQKAQQQMRGMQQGAGMKGQGGMPIKGQGMQVGSGAKVGSAVAKNSREQGDKLNAVGKERKLTGQKGRGASQKMIENSASGSAISQRRARKVNNEFSYKMEEFIERNDVPDGMKTGVKRYFSDLHKR